MIFLRHSPQARSGVAALVILRRPLRRQGSGVMAAASAKFVGR